MMKKQCQLGLKQTQETWQETEAYIHEMLCTLECAAWMERLPEGEV